MRCSVTESLQVVEGKVADYQKLKRFHYRDGSVGAVDKVFKIIETDVKRSRLSDVVGVIVYGMPRPNLEGRSIAAGETFHGYNDKGLQMQLVNMNVRCVSRVVIDPRYRGLGLAVRLLKETFEKMDYPMIESLAVMGQVNPFFEKAGMSKVVLPLSEQAMRLGGMLEAAGIEKKDWLSWEKVHRGVDSLQLRLKQIIIKAMDDFVHGYGRRYDGHSPERTKYILQRLESRPNYYYLFKEDVPLRLCKG